jgi:hypothetical protein
MADAYREFEAYWKKEGDSRWVWRVMRTCIHRKEPIPNWCLDYICNVAEGIEHATGDRGRALLGVLGLPKGKGRPRGAELRIERFAAEFMKLVMKGMSPGRARAEAASLHGIGTDSEVQYLRNFFRLKSLPTSDAATRWKLIFLDHCLHNPMFRSRYPDAAPLGAPDKDGKRKPAFDFRGK